MRTAPTLTPDQIALHPHAGQETTIPSSMTQLDAHDRRLMRTAWIVLAAMAITSVLLWWIMHP
jgi:hypothetical protein